MILVLCFCERDQELALKNVRWWNELGGCKGHKVMVWRDKRTDPKLSEQIQSELFKCFDDVMSHTAGGEVDGWPQGANYFFRLAAGYLQNKPECRYYFWMEPDAIPLVPGWMDALEAEYKRVGKPFMGDRVEVQQIPLHMSGVGIYWNPLHEKAGEAYRAHDLAWDMAAKDQIVPQAHFTKLIEHAWQHPPFSKPWELSTQIRAGAVIFHSSKDGSLIDMLRKKRGGIESAAPMPAHTQKVDSPSPLPSGKVSDIFIRTYQGDYEWLEYCVRSIEKFATGFRKVWIVSPHNPPVWMLEHSQRVVPMPIEWKVLNEEAEDGYLSQQIHKLYADTFSDADYILHIDSDTIFIKPTTPEHFFSGGKIMWPYTPYSSIETPWKPITEKFIGQPVDYEFMRRFPFLLPRWLYPKLRKYCHMMHGRIISDYIRVQPLRAFSEFNALGAYAYFNHKDQFCWINTLQVALPEPVCKQYHSWSGFNSEIRKEIETFLGGDATCHGTQLSSAASNAAPTVQPASAAKEQLEGDHIFHPDCFVQIKKLPNDIWVIEGEQISGWVEQHGRLDHDQFLIPFITSHIKEGDTVIDVGAFIGDHTIAYVRKAGIKGTVHAFEPNPMAYVCLTHNISEAKFYNVALGETRGKVPISTRDDGDYSGAFVGSNNKIAEVEMEPLDWYELKPNLIKIDVEGYELSVLKGAEKTIAAHQPIIVLEIQEDGLKRQGVTRDAIFDWLKERHYRWLIIEEHMPTDPLYNIIALPRDGAPAITKNNSVGAEPTSDEPSSREEIGVSPGAPFTIGELTIIDHVRAVKNYSESTKDKRIYIKRLFKKHGMKLTLSVVKGKS